MQDPRAAADGIMEACLGAASFDFRRPDLHQAGARRIGRIRRRVFQQPVASVIGIRIQALDNEPKPSASHCKTPDEHPYGLRGASDGARIPYFWRRSTVGKAD